MLRMLFLLAVGMVLGFLTRRRRRWILRIEQFTMFFLYGFLGLLGMSVGMNAAVMDHLAEMGGQALLLSVAGILGSVLLGSGIERTIFIHLSKRAEHGAQEGPRS